MGKGKLTPKTNDPEDRRRADEAEETFQPRSHKRFKVTPHKKLLRNGEFGIIDDGATRQIVVRIDGTLYTVNLTAV